MKLPLFALSICGILGLPLWAIGAQVIAPATIPRRAPTPVSALNPLVLPPTDVAMELAADVAAGNPMPFRFAVARPVNLTPETHGFWENVPGGRIWRVKVICAGATDLNFGFSSYWLPPGATLHVVSEETEFYQGPYTSDHNAEHGELWTALVPGGVAYIELFVPEEVNAQPKLVLAQVSTGYRNIFTKQFAIGTGPAPLPCQIDVECPIAVPWTNEIRSVAAYTISGVAYCSGTIIMNALGDFRPLFLTAAHCEVNATNAPSIVTYWNYQSASCGLHGTQAQHSLFQNISGATFRASRQDVDFCLIELSAMPPAEFGVYYAGWDRSGNVPTGGVGIHHPQVAGKCISFATTAPRGPTGVSFVEASDLIELVEGDTHWFVDWSQGMTEPGSSGSGLWDPVSRNLVGTLTGAPIPTCANDNYSLYGRFSVSWDHGSSSAERLRASGVLKGSQSGLFEREPSS